MKVTGLEALDAFDKQPYVILSKSPLILLTVYYF